MLHRLFTLVGGLCVTLWLLSAVVAPLASSAYAQSNDAKPADNAAPAAGAAGLKPGKEPQKIDEFAEAQKALNDRAGNPECVWLGRRVVSLLWRDDLDTAFRHPDLYGVDSVVRALISRPRCGA